MLEMKYFGCLAWLWNGEYGDAEGYLVDAVGARQSAVRSKWNFFTNSSESPQSRVSGSIWPSSQSTRTNQHPQVGLSQL